MNESLFPPGTPVCVRQTVAYRSGPVHTEIIGVVERWEELPTGAWFAHGKHDKLWLTRLKLRKVDGEISLIVVDEGTQIAKLEVAPGSRD